MTDGTNPLVDADALEGLAADVLLKAGCDAEGADLASRTLVAADRRAIFTHGTARLHEYASAVTTGKLNGRPEPRCVRETTSVSLWDGDEGLGAIVARRVADDTIARAKGSGSGIAFAAARNSGHIGAVGHYALHCADQGLIGIAISNTPAVVAPPGGTVAVVGNGPFSWAVPSGDGSPPYVFDASWGLMSGSAVHLAARLGERLPDGVIVDPDGHPSTDPRAYGAGGALNFSAAHKGYGMALLAELLTATLASGTPGVRLPRGLQGFSFAFAALDPAAFGSSEDFVTRVAELADAIHGAGARLPGELSGQAALAAAQDGIPMPEWAWVNVVQAANAFGLADRIESLRPADDSPARAD
jgi:LDH2 family malate/lactate/ureidoglycolate dehydrogenase